jgi:hypothetical protein
MILHAIFDTDKKEIQKFYLSHKSKLTKITNSKLGPESTGLESKISFSSKVCHFISPKIIFIFDSNSVEAARQCCTTLHLNEMVQKLSMSIDQYKAKKKNVYLLHCCRLYLLTKMVKKD